MHELLLAAETLLDIQLPNLRASADRTSQRVEAAREAVDDFLNVELGSDRDADSEAIIGAFGSMARDEMAAGSDFDYLVILRRLEADPERIQVYRAAAGHALDKLGVDPPGASGLFGCAVSGTDLVNTIGLDTDTNLHLSRRILLLEESTPLNAKEAHQELIETVAARYLHERETDKPEVPRFLLNDVIRYWRTVAVDYQAKRWDEVTGAKWALRYVKLLSTRKVVFAGTVASLFWPVITGIPTDAVLLRTQFCLPATARLAQLAPHVAGTARKALAEVLIEADEFNGMLTNGEFRRALSGVDPSAAPPGTPIANAKDHGVALQRALEDLFFSEEPLLDRPDYSLGKLTRHYLSF